MWKQQKSSDAESVQTGRIEAGERANRSVPQRVVEHASAAPHAIALRASGGRTMTYGELDQRADAVAGYLSSIGVGPETVVGIALDRSFERIVACLGVWRAGGAFLPLDPSWPEARQRSLLDDAQALAVIGHADTVNHLASASRLPVALGAHGDALAQFAVRAVRETNHPGDLAYVIYTSGSTGEPHASASSANRIHQSGQAGAEQSALQSVALARPHSLRRQPRCHAQLRHRIS